MQVVVTPKSGDEAMQYLVAGILKPGNNDRLVALHDEFNDHIGQASDRIALFGLLRDKSGQRAGYLAFIEAETFDEAERFLQQSPFYQNDLYERVEVAEFTPEVGAFESA
jgi:uncharacterized protein YciI